MSDRLVEGSDFELARSGDGEKPLVVVARLCLPPRGSFSTLGICKRLRIMKMSMGNKVKKGRWFV